MPFFLENAMLFPLDLIKEIDEAHKETDDARMEEKIIDIMYICEATGIFSGFIACWMNTSRVSLDGRENQSDTQDASETRL